MDKSKLFVSYAHEVPELLGSKHWYDLNYSEQDHFLMACFEGPKVWKEEIKKLDLFDRIGLSIAQSLLGDEFSEYTPKNSVEKERILACRMKDLEDTLLGARCLRANVRINWIKQGGKLGTHSNQDDPMLIFDFLDAAKTKGFEYLSFDCTRRFAELEEEAKKEFNNLSYVDQQKYMKDLEKEVADVLGIKIPEEPAIAKNILIKPRDRSSAFSEVLNVWNSMDAKETRAAIYFLIACICILAGHYTTGSVLYAILTVDFFLTDLAEKQRKFDDEEERLQKEEVRNSLVIDKELKLLLEYSSSKGVCPMPDKWDKLYKMLPNRMRKGNAWEPPLPLILGAWHHSPPFFKRIRFIEHIEWAASNGALDRVDRFIRSLPDDDWFKIKESEL